MNDILLYKKNIELEEKINNLEQNSPETGMMSYLAFVTNANQDAVSAAFGKNNESRVKGIGKALAMYAWYHGETAEFTELQKCDTFIGVPQEAKYEIEASPAIMALVENCDYTRPTFHTELCAYILDEVFNPGTLESINAFLASERMSKIREDKYGYPLLTERMTVITEDGVYTVPEGRTAILVIAIGGGGGGGCVYGQNSGNTGGGGGGSGYYDMQVIQVQPGDEFSVVIGQGGAGQTGINGNGSAGTETKFGDIITVAGGNGGTGANNGTGAGGSGGANGGRGSTAAGSIDQAMFPIKVGKGGANNGSYGTAGGGGGGIYPVISGSNGKTNDGYIQSYGGTGYGAGGGGAGRNGADAGKGAPGAVFII